MSRPLTTPAPWRALGLPGHMQCRRVYVLADGLTVRVDDTGHLDAVHLGGRPKPGAAWDLAPGRRP